MNTIGLLYIQQLSSLSRQYSIEILRHLIFLHNFWLENRNVIIQKMKLGNPAREEQQFLACLATYFKHLL